MPALPQKPSKHATVYASLLGDLQAGRLRGGDRLPTEAQLVRQFGVSRITVSRAVRDLQAAGLVERKPGSGTFVRGSRTAGGLSLAS